MVLFSRQLAPDWTGAEDPEAEAKCRKLPRPAFGADPFFDDEEYALSVCNGGDHAADYENAGQQCPMRSQCLIFSLINHEGAGIWGGMHTDDRMNLKRNLPRREWKWHPPTQGEQPELDSVPLAA